MQMYGESLVASLLEQLPSDNYYWKPEHRVISPERRSSYQHIDFVLVGAKLGVIVFEVKDWVDIVGFDDKTVTIQRRDGNRVQEKNPTLVARSYAINLSHHFMKNDALLQTQNPKGKTRLTFPWNSAVILPNVGSVVIQAGVELGIWEDGEVIGNEDLIDVHRFEKAIKNIPSKWRLKEPLGETVIDLIRGSLNPSWVISDKQDKPIGVVTRQQQSEIERPLQIPSPSEPVQMKMLDMELLTEDAEAIIRQESVRLLRGVAGSGKSLVLARRAQFLSETYPNLRILVVAYNKDLTGDIRAKLKTFPNIEVYNFDKLCRDIMGEFWISPFDLEGWLNHFYEQSIVDEGMSAKFIADEIEWRIELNLIDAIGYFKTSREGRGQSLSKKKRQFIQEIFVAYQEYCSQQSAYSWKEVAKQTYPFLSKENPFYQKYDAVLVDEAQDFAPTWIAIIKRLLKLNGYLFMCDDPTQSLFRTYSWRQKGIEVVGRTRVLRVPFRCTQQIIQAAYSLIEADSQLKDSDEITKPDLSSLGLTHLNWVFCLNKGLKPLACELNCVTPKVMN